MTTEHEYTSLFLFSGLGAGAEGFLRASATIAGRGVRFRALGGVDNDPLSCRDFEYLTGAPALCADLETLRPDALRAFCPASPDVVFMSPPCKGYSRLIANAARRTKKYRRMNLLALWGIKLLVSTWARGPRLILLENVPGIATMGRALLRKIRRLLRAAGYVVSPDEQHDCGEIGGLAQHRTRYLLVARHASVPALLYKPIKRRVRGCGEVLGTLPLPGDAAAGPLHQLPRITLRNWLRLAAIPPGGDHRDLADALKPQPENVGLHAHKYAVFGWAQPTGAVIGESRLGSGAPSVADPRFNNVFVVLPWDRAAGAVTSGHGPSSGAASVADPRVAPADLGPGTYANHCVVLRWHEPARAVTSATRPYSGALSVADITALACAVADPRVPGNPPLALRFYPRDLDSAPPFAPVLPTVDGTWHRPLTTLELAALQGLPTVVDGRPLQLAGRSVGKIRERIGNAVPVGAAEAIARQMLITLAQADAGAWALSSGGDVWVAPTAKQPLLTSEGYAE